MTRNQYRGGTVAIHCATKAKGRKAVTWLNNRGILARYDAETRELWTPDVPFVAGTPIGALERALDAVG